MELDLEDQGRFDVAGLVKENPIPFVLFIIGMILFGASVFFFRGEFSKSGTIEVIDVDSDKSEVLVVEVSGAVDTPGVYELEKGSRVEEALKKAGGVVDSADIDWIERTLNRAAKAKDGQKIYIPYIEDSNQHSEVLSAKDFDRDQTISSENLPETEKRVNINQATQEELEELWGIGPVTGKNIIEQRPYSNIEELLEKNILKKNVYDRNKDLMTVY
jgi:competence protein ComEA